jgi:epoxyqueuosine reductase
MQTVSSNLIKKIIMDRVRGLDALEIIPLVDLGPALDHTVGALERGFVPSTYGWTRKKTEFAYGYKGHTEWAKSIIVAAKYYYTDEHVPKDAIFGRISRFTWRNNYQFLKLKLGEAIDGVGEYLGKKIRAKMLSNYTSIPEKVLFRYSGLADVGKNSVCIHMRMGSYFVIGEALTDLVTEVVPGELSAPQFSLCGGCTRCIDACPTGAIKEDGTINITSCLQYISENPILMPRRYRELWGNRLYGCSTCIDVCPYNEKLEPWAEKHEIGRVGPGMNLTEVLSLNEQEWSSRFSQNQIGIREPRSILKNAITALGCLQYKGAQKNLISYTTHPDGLLRIYAAWVLGRMGTRTSKTVLERMHKHEEIPSVRAEIEFFL